MNPNHSPKKKSQKRMLFKLKSWTKKLITSPKTNSNFLDNDSEKIQSELNDTIPPQISHPSLDDSGIGLRRDRNIQSPGESLTKSRSSGALNMKASTMLTTIEEQKTSTPNMFSDTSVKATSSKKQRVIRRDSFFGVTRLSSILSSRISRVSSTTTNHVNACNLPELVEEPFDFDFIFNEFDCNSIDELEDESEDLLNESKNLNESRNLPDLSKSKLDHTEFYNAIPVVVGDDAHSDLLSFAVPPPNTTKLLSSNSLLCSPRISMVGIECAACTYMNYPIMTFCEICRVRLPGSSARSSQCSTTYNNKSVISVPYSNIISPITKTQVTLLKKNDIEYIAVRDMFYSEVPYAVIKEIKGIVRLDMPTKLVKIHERYKFKVATRSGKSTDDVTFSMFHGTTTSFNCDPSRFLDTKYDNNSFCKKSCGMCGIIQHGNKKKFSKHGRKMWFAHSALISRDYTGISSNTKVMFVVDVVAEEHNWILVVNKNKATLPRFVILFE